MIDKTQQHAIIRNLKVIAIASELDKEQIEERFRLLIVGAVVAIQTLGQEAPPHWLINIQCGRVDRLMEEVK